MADDQKKEAEVDEEANTPKLRVVVEEKSKKVKKFASAGSATLNYNLRRGIKKLKKAGLTALELTSTFVENRKSKRK